MTMLKRLLSTMALLVLAACGGGGGDAGTPPFPGGGSGGNGGGGGGGGGTPVTGAPTITLSLSSSTITQTAPATVTATVRNASGAPVAGAVVALTTTRNDVGQLTAASVLTDANGTGSVTLQAAVAGVIGADEVQASTTVGSTALTARVGFAVTSPSTTINVSISSTTLRVSTGPATLTAIVRDAAGAPVSGAIVSFASASGTVALGTASALTDATGSASTTARPANASISGAEALTASVRVNNRDFQSSVNVQLVADSTAPVGGPAIALTLSSSTVTQTTPATATVTVRDANGLPVPGSVVQFTTSRSDVGRVSAPTALTDGTGVASVSLQAAPGGVAAADEIVASTTVTGTAISARAGYSVTTASSTINIAITSTTLRTSGSPATLTAVVRNAVGAPVSGAIVSFSAAGGAVALGAASALTDANGAASTTARPSSSAMSGAEQLSASVSLNGNTFTSSVNVQVIVDTAIPTGSPSVTLALSSETITQNSPATLTAVVRDGNGVPIRGSVVTLRTSRSDVGQLSATSVLTDSNGTGSVTLRAAPGGVIGADEVQASANLGTTTVSGRIGFAVTAPATILSLNVAPATVSGSTPGTASATVLSATGAPIANALVRFGSANGRVVVDPISAVTNSSGVATTTVRPADASVGVADTVVASVDVSGATFQSNFNVQVLAERPQLALDFAGATNVSTQATPLTLLASVRNAAGAPVSSAVVTFSTQFGLGTYSVNTALTDATGVATVTLAPRNATTAGADVAVAAVTVDGVTRTVQRAMEFRVGSTTGEPELTVSISPARLTPTDTGTVTLTLRNAAGSAEAGRVIALSTQRGNLATLGASSVLTGADGRATVTLRSANATALGADEVIATATLGGVSLQGRAGFQVEGAAAPTLTLLSAPANGNASTTQPATISATLRRLDGSPAAGQLVSFSSVGGLARLSAAQVVTNGAGVATVTAQPLTAGTSGSDFIAAIASVDSRTVQAQAAVQLIAQQPQLEIVSLTNTDVTAAAPVTMRVRVRDLAGAVVPNALVSFGSALNLASFTPTTVVTDPLGEATTVVSPRLPTSAGGDLVTASVVVAGITASDQRRLSFVGAAPSGNPTLDLSLSSSSISAASPATVTATLRDPIGTPIAGQVVTFDVVRGLATTNVVTALTNASGVAQVILSPASSVTAGADEITASVSYAGVGLQRTVGFQVQATSVQLLAFTSQANPLAAYGQTTLSLVIDGASVTSPVNISVSSSCVAQGKATLSPSTFTANETTVTMQYRDNGCGAVQASDQLLAVVTATGVSRSLSLGLQSPAESSIAFVSASPEQIYLRGSGFVESSIVTFEVRDAAGNPLPGRVVELRLTTGAGGVTMEGRGVESVSPPGPNPFTLTSNALGRVSVRVNSGTQPTPVRINARLSGSGVSTVSSNLSVAIGLPSQLNFSLSQATKNIEGYNIDGTPNTYQIIAADRSGNPVPNGTSINFVTEGGQVEAIRQTTIVNGIARTVAQFVSADPRPVDGRVTITAYGLGEESFIDLNGNNIHDQQIAESFSDVNGNGVYDLGEPFVDLNGNGVRDTLPTPEPFQDLGNIFKDRNFDGEFNPLLDEFVPLNINNSQLCVPPVAPAFASLLGIYAPILGLDASIPSVRTSSCDSRWSGAGQVYVRRATETVLSTSGARALWAGTSGLDGTCRKINMQVGNLPSQTDEFTLVAGDTWYGGRSGTLSFIAADANPGNLALGLLPRLNPMAAGTTITAASPTTGVTVTVGGSPVPSTTSATGASVAYSFGPTAPASGVVLVTFTSPSGTATTYGITIDTVTPRPTVCP